MVPLSIHTEPYGGRTVNWLTPRWILDRFGPFDLDPCAAPDQPWPTAETQWTAFDNGLTKPWFGRVWLNPPFGAETKRWLRRMAAHNDGIALTFARTETQMFFDSVWGRAAAILFLRGRPHFCLPNGKPAHGNSGGPIVLIAYGYRNADALRASRLPGMFVALS